MQDYLPSIDHAILKATLRRHLRDERVLALLERIIDGSPDPPPTEPAYFPGDDLLTPLERRCGIPIGNLTSQFFANLYLNDLDHGIKEVLRAPAYLRYVDDMVLLADAKQELWAWRDWIAERLAEIRLRLHPAKAKVSRVGEGLDVLGYFVFPQRPALAQRKRPAVPAPVARFRPRLRRGSAGLGRFRPQRASVDRSRPPRGNAGAARKPLFGSTLSARPVLNRGGSSGAIPPFNKGGEGDLNARVGVAASEIPPTPFCKGGSKGQSLADHQGCLSGNGPKGGPRVVRGGSWNHEPKEAAIGRAQQERPAQQEQQHRVPSGQAAHRVPEPPRSRMRRAWRVGVHESVSRTRRDGSAE
ncbi:MAG: reverse transcriptase domain-containing protein [Chromatiales bacterium]|nr:reverse transcriptase domain-containing protein [Chromatiales bacterium]